MRETDSSAENWSEMRKDYWEDKHNDSWQEKIRA